MSHHRDGLLPLRSLVILIFGFVVSGVVGCGMMNGPSEYEKFMQKRKSFEQIVADAGGKATKEGREMFGFKAVGWFIDLSGVKITDKLIAQIVEIGGAEGVFVLDLSKSEITDAQLKKLDEGKVLVKTVDLNLADTQITDAGLDQLSEYYCVMKLNLKGSKATKQGAKRLSDKKIANQHTPAPFKKAPELII